MSTTRSKAPARYEGPLIGNVTPIAAPADATTLLRYAVLVTPDPLQIERPGTITLEASNSSRQTVTCKSISVTLMTGTNAKDLTTNAAALDIRVPADWSSENHAGAITFKPTKDSAGQIGPRGLIFTISGFVVNAQVGITTVSIDETASVGSQPAKTRTAAIDIPKFPQKFDVSDLQADPLDVMTGDTTTLRWSGPSTGPAGTPPTYTLKYQPADEGKPLEVGVGNTGPFTSVALTRGGSVSFALIVSVKIPGQDSPLVVSRYANVSVESVTAQLTALPPVVGTNGLVRLRWKTANASQCRIDPDVGEVGLDGDAYVVVPAFRVYTLTAFDAHGNITQAQTSVSTDARIKPNQPGHTLGGAAGGAGGNGANARLEVVSRGRGINPEVVYDYYGPDNGGTGGPGGDANLVVTLPLLDPSSSPARVIPINVIGGTGGVGGKGGDNHVRSAGPGSGGNGGQGGAAILTATFDSKAGPPAQYIVTLTPGVGGPPGSGGTGMSGGQGARGSQGAPGTTAIVVKGRGA